MYDKNHRHFIIRKKTSCRSAKFILSVAGYEMLENEMGKILEQVFIKFCSGIGHDVSFH